MCFAKVLKSKLRWRLLGFCLVSRRDDGPRRSNRIGEDEDLMQKKQIKTETD